MADIFMTLGRRVQGLITLRDRLLRSLCMLVLAMLVTACNATGKAPTSALIEQAIALQVNQTQQALSQQLKLNLDASRFAVQHLTITAQTPLMIDNLQAFRVQGTYDLLTKLSKRDVTQRQNPFEVYLQRQAEGKTWRAARLETDATGAPIWITHRLPY
jgi:hypothetical protein